MIATVLYCDRSIDAFGTGFERVFKMCKRNEYTYSSNQFGFTFEFLRNHIDSYNESINDPIKTLTEDENKILEIIKSGRRLTRDEMAQEISKSKATVQRCIKSLLDKGFIKRVGSNKTGYWMISLSHGLC